MSHSILKVTGDLTRSSVCGLQGAKPSWSQRQRREAGDSRYRQLFPWSFAEKGSKLMRW